MIVGYYYYYYYFCDSTNSLMVDLVRVNPYVHVCLFDVDDTSTPVPLCPTSYAPSYHGAYLGINRNPIPHRCITFPTSSLQNARALSIF